MCTSERLRKRAFENTGQVGGWDETRGTQRVMIDCNIRMHDLTGGEADPEIPFGVKWAKACWGQCVIMTDGNDPANDYITIATWKLPNEMSPNL